MAKTYLFYDLETSGLNPRQDRIMQFAAIRTDLDFNQIGEPYNILVKLNNDSLPSPDAIILTGISPQQTVEEGYSEADFARILINDIFTTDTIIVGFNNIRFDDEFIRYLFWRTFYDPYEWHWKDGRSRWDLLDVVRMTRALRPDGISWPTIEGKAVNKLELITKQNGIEHLNAHDALSDVYALIEVTKLISVKQPRLFQYLLNIRDKKQVQKLVNLDDKKAFVYTSGRLDAEHNKTTVAFPLTAGKNGNVVIYDLRYDPSKFLDMKSNEISKKLNSTWGERQDSDYVKLPIKELQYNSSPAVAPIGVLDSDNSWSSIHLDKEMIYKNQETLLSSAFFAENVRSAYENITDYEKDSDAEARLYDGFLADLDRLRIEKVRQSDSGALADLNPEFIDERLPDLLLHYKARNYPSSLSESEMDKWEKWRSNHVNKQIASFMKSINAIKKKNLDNSQIFIVQELELWLENIASDS